MPLDVYKRLRVVKGAVFIKRKLHGGKPVIFVKNGVDIKPEDVLGESESSGGFTTVHLANQLNIAPKIAVEFLKRKIGQTIYKGELLAQRDGFWGFKKTILLASADGILDFYDAVTGILRIKLIPHKERLISGVFGLVANIDTKSAEITVKTLAYQMYGVAGSGMERSGILKVIGPRNLLVSSKQINQGLGGSIIVGGAMVFTDALQKAVHSEVSGIISGGFNLADLKAMRGGSLDFSREIFSDVGLSVMVTEGFGAIPIGDDIYDILKVHNDRFALLDGNKAKLILPTGDARSIIQIQKLQTVDSTGLGGKSFSTDELRAGVKVRVIASLDMGAVGVVDSIDKTPTKLPSDILVNMATILTKTGKIRVPTKNLEVLDDQGSV